MKPCLSLLFFIPIILRLIIAPVHGALHIQRIRFPLRSIVSATSDDSGNQLFSADESLRSGVLRECSDGSGELIRAPLQNNKRIGLLSPGR